MTTRRDELIDSAVQVVARTGAKGLTHRAVDAAAGAPQGSTSNHFRTRTALVAAIAARMEERDLARWQAPVGADVPDDRPGNGLTVPELVARLTAFAAGLCADADLTLARLALAQELPSELAGGHHRLLGMLREVLTAAGVPDPADRAPLVAAFLDGQVQHTITVRRDAAFDEDACRRGLTLLLAQTPEETTKAPASEGLRTLSQHSARP